MSISEQLGNRRDVTLDQGTIRYRERGNGQPIVFVHGLLVNGDLWRKVVPGLAKDFRCITPDWPLGSHELPMKPDADLSPPALAKLIADFLAELKLEDVTLVANDTGGAFSQLLVTEHADRVGRLVLTPSDAFESFFPPIFRYLQWLGHVPRSGWLIAQTLRVGAIRRLPIALGWFSKRPIEPAIIDAYFTPLRSSRAVRRDLEKVLRGVDAGYTLRAAERLEGFRRPVLLAWAREDRLFPLELAERLAARLPDARIEQIEDSYTFVPEDQPERLSELIAAFAREPAPAVA
jgi:pimeloyl-ACP methyl ester carboxylesterase